jgi:hypothetical protein
MLVEQESKGRDTVEIVSKESLRHDIERYQTLERSLKAAFSGHIPFGGRTQHVQLRGTR